MFFNSLDFAVFLPIVFISYWFFTARNLKLQNALIVVASYVFYGWWDWRFLSLILFSSIVDFSIGNKLRKEEKDKNRKILLWSSIVVNLGLLGFFKYYNFFIESFESAFSFFGQDLSLGGLEIVLPVGISFYTFQTLSYTIDVYKKKLEPTSDFIAFSAFVSFFPQLVAGPIERATNLLPQFYFKRSFDRVNAINGLRQMLWGFFKKMVIADNCAQFANDIFANADVYGGSTLFIGAIFFSFQIYGDFSGYSDIAIGLSRLFGFELKQNFAFPYFSRDIAEFWRRWHMSLSTWFRDYLYIPLGGSKGGNSARIRNTFIIFLVSGFWHGANWTFVIWGALNAIYFLPLLLSGKNRNNLNDVAEGRMFPTGLELIKMLRTFILAVTAWVFFRAEDVGSAFEYLGGIFSQSFFTLPSYSGIEFSMVLMLLLTFFMIIEWLGRRDQYAIEQLLLSKSRIFRWSFYAFLIFLIGMFSSTDETAFIYFQF